MTGDLYDAFASGDFIKHAGMSGFGGGGTTKKSRGRPPKNKERELSDQQVGDFSGYLHFGNEGVESGRRNDYLAYIPDVGTEKVSVKQSQEEKGFSHLGSNLVNIERQGERGYKRAKGYVKRVRGHIVDQKIGNEQMLATRYERFKEKRLVKKGLKAGNPLPEKQENKPTQQQNVGQEEPVQVRDTTSKNPLHAAHGFHGVIDHPTHMLVGENGPEIVNITPIKKKKNNRIYDVSEHFKGVPTNAF